MFFSPAHSVHVLFPVIGSLSYIYISQGSVATQLKCGGIFSDVVIANFPQSTVVNEFLKSVNTNKTQFAAFLLPTV